MAFARRARRLAPTIVVAVVASVIAAFAVHATGNVVQRPDLNNSGIWASSDADALFGRFNKSASTTEFALAPKGVAPPSGVHWLQAGDTGIGHDLTKSALIPVETVLAWPGLDNAEG